MLPEPQMEGPGGRREQSLLGVAAEIRKCSAPAALILNCPKEKVAFTSAPSASSAPVPSVSGVWRESISIVIGSGGGSS